MYTDYALKPTNRFYHILIMWYSISYMCICCYYYVSLNIPHYTGMEHIEYTGFWRGGGTSMFIFTHICRVEDGVFIAYGRQDAAVTLLCLSQLLCECV